MRLLRRLRTAYDLLRLMGAKHFLRHIFLRYAVSQKIWERVFVETVSGFQLREAIKNLHDFRSNDLVSIILPVNNGRSKGVERLVESLKKQTHQKLEFIAVDSGSTDDTVPWLQSQGFNVVQIDPKSFTHAFSRNTGAAAAKGKYLLFVVDDVIFKDPDWIRVALFLIEKFKADSMSSRQTIDDKADAYARCLDSFLSHGQNDQVGVNLARNNALITALRKIIPLQPQFRSVAIDDTNHLVRREVFEKIRFRTPTVEDIDFALRLTRSGGKTLYTNIISVLHYHKYSIDTLHKYAKRVYIDSGVMGHWQPPMMVFPSRESFLVAAWHTLGLFLQAFHTLDAEITAIGETQRRYADPNTVNASYVDALLNLTIQLDSNQFGTFKYRFRNSFDEARELFLNILGGEPPSDIYHERQVSKFFMRALRTDLAAVKLIIFANDWEVIDRVEVKTVFLSLWVNRVMSAMAQSSNFRKSELSFECDSWGIENWE